MKKLNELTNDELFNLFEKNAWLREKMCSFCEESVNDYISDYLYGFRKINGLEYSIGYNDYFTFNGYRAGVQGYEDFIYACMEVQRSYCLFSDKTETLLKRINAKLELYTEAWQGYRDISDKNYERLEKWIDKGIETLCNEILSFCKDIYDSAYDKDYQEEELLNFVEWNGSDYETDGTYIYETIHKKYA